MLEHYTQGADGLMPALLTRFILLKDVAADAFSTLIFSSCNCNWLVYHDQI